jgi:hypothetical protein
MLDNIRTNVQNQKSYLVIKSILFFIFMVDSIFLEVLPVAYLTTRNFGFVQYIALFPCHIIPVMAFFGFIVGLFFSNTVGAVIQISTALLAFSHLTILATMLYTGHYTYITGIITYLVLITTLFVCSIFEFIIACRQYKGNSDEQKEEVL